MGYAARGYKQRRALFCLRYYLRLLIARRTRRAFRRTSHLPRKRPGALLLTRHLRTRALMGTTQRGGSSTISAVSQWRINPHAAYGLCHGTELFVPAAAAAQAANLGPGPAARSYRPKAAILARFKGNNTRRPLFFSACVGMILVNNISARNKSRREVGGPAQRLQRQSSNSRGDILPPPLTSFERFQPESA
jgi:hypothetical protein